MISTCDYCLYLFFFSSRRRHTILQGDWSSDVCSSDLPSCKGATPCPRPASRAERHTFPTHLAAPAHAFVGIDDGRAPGRFLPWTGHHKKSEIGRAHV